MLTLILDLLHPPSAVEFVPKTKVSIGYIVVTVLFNESNQVLLIQEAKKSCHGTWYLPAGRLELNETFVVRGCCATTAGTWSLGRSSLVATTFVGGKKNTTYICRYVL